MILSDSTQKITVKTSAIPTTNSLSYTSYIYDQNPALTDGPLIQGRGTFDDIGVDIVSPPTLTLGITYPKLIMEFTAINLDTVAHTVEFKFVSNTGAVDVPIFKVIMQPDDVVTYTKEKGWLVMDENGKIKASSSPECCHNKSCITSPSVTLDADYDIITQNNTEAVGNLAMLPPSGAAKNGQILQFHLKSTNVQTFVWDAVFAGSVSEALPTVSSGATKTDKMFFQFNIDVAKWQLVNLKLGYT